MMPQVPPKEVMTGMAPDLLGRSPKQPAAPPPTQGSDGHPGDVRGYA